MMPPQMAPQGGAMQPGGPAPGGMQGGMPKPGGPGGPGGPGMDPQAYLQKFVDPNNKLQMLLLQRLDQMPDQQKMALVSMGPEAATALKQILPEIGFMIDLLVLQTDPMGGQGPQGGAPMAPPPGSAGPGAPLAPGGGGGRLASLMG